MGQIIATDRIVMAVEQNKVLIPNTFQKFLSWGFSDRSVRIGTYDSEKVSFSPSLSLKLLMFACFLNED